MVNVMKKFMVLYMAPPESFAQMMRQATPEQQRKGMDAWMAWMNKHSNAIVDGGAPLGKARRVDTKGSSDTKNSLGGYSIVQANSHDEAAKLFGSDHPHLHMPGAWIEITEIMPIPGM
jgi:hypothetical protein